MYKSCRSVVDKRFYFLIYALVYIIKLKVSVHFRNYIG